MRYGFVAWPGLVRRGEERDGNEIDASVKDSISVDLVGGVDDVRDLQA